MNKIIQQLADCLHQLEYLKPEKFDNDNHEANYHALLAQVRTTIQNPTIDPNALNDMKGGHGTTTL